MGKLTPAQGTLPARPQSNGDVGRPVPIPTENMSSISMPPGLPGGAKNTGIQSLWTKAINNPELPTQERKVLAEIGIETDTIQISLSLGAMMEDILMKQKGKEWKVKFRGDDIVLGHIGMKILHWVDKFKQIGDLIMQFDPVHAALPWAGFRFLLKVELSLPCLNRTPN